MALSKLSTNANKSERTLSSWSWLDLNKAYLSILACLFISAFVPLLPFSSARLPLFLMLGEKFKCRMKKHISCRKWNFHLKNLLTHLCCSSNRPWVIVLPRACSGLVFHAKSNKDEWALPRFPALLGLLVTFEAMSRGQWFDLTLGPFQVCFKSGYSDDEIEEPSRI